MPPSAGHQRGELTGRLHARYPPASQPQPVAIDRPQCTVSSLAKVSKAKVPPLVKTASAAELPPRLQHSGETATTQPSSAARAATRQSRQQRKRISMGGSAIGACADANPVARDGSRHDAGSNRTPQPPRPAIAPVQIPGVSGARARGRRTAASDRHRRWPRWTSPRPSRRLATECSRTARR